MSDVEEHSDLEPTFPGDSDVDDTDSNITDTSDIDSEVDDENEQTEENSGVSEGNVHPGSHVSLQLPVGLDMSGGESGESDYSDVEDDSGSEEEDEIERSTFDKEDRTKFLSYHHPEVAVPSFEEVRSLCKVAYDKSGIIVDPLHTTQPVLTKYEKARLIGVRATQLANGARPMVDLGPKVISDLVIAEEELKQKKLPFIVRRPMPNGGSEYWKLKDLMVL